MKRRAIIATVFAAACLVPVAGPALAGDPWLDRVRSFEPGTSSGFGAEELPGIVLGTPEGLGENQGSLDVVSLGHAGSITVTFSDNVVVDGDGDDLVIFENAFLSGSLLFAELAFVEVSTDGQEWFAFPYDEETGDGLAGRAPVLANTANGLDPLAPEAGGDRFDLADIGLSHARFVRIVDAGDLIDDPGNHSFVGTKGGFDLDAAAAIHSSDLGCISGTVSDGETGVEGVRVVVAGDGERRRRRRTREDGSYRVCKLTPRVEYDVRSEREGVGSAQSRVLLDEQDLRVVVDLVLE